MMPAFGEYDWGSIRLLDVFRVKCHEVGTVSNAFGRTDIYQFGVKFSGRTEVVYNGKTIDYRAGSVLYLPKEKSGGIPYNKTFLKDGETICIFFDSEKPLPSIPFIVQNGCKYTDAVISRLEKAFNEIKGSKFKCASLFYEFLYELESAAVGNDTVTNVFLSEVYGYIDRHICDEYIDREAMASEFGLSAEHFRHKFKSLCGLSLQEYCNRVKISKIKELLRESDVSVSEAARMTGFSGVNYFSRFFKKHTGISPGEYRRSVSQLQ